MKCFECFNFDVINGNIIFRFIFLFRSSYQTQHKCQVFKPHLELNFDSFLTIMFGNVKAKLK